MRTDRANDTHLYMQAHRLVHTFGLQLAFPDIEQLYSRDALLKLMERHKWALALAYVGSDSSLQTVLLNHLVAAREWRLALQLAKDRMGLMDFDPETHEVEGTEGLLFMRGTSSHSTSLQTLPVHGYVELPLREDAIVWCDSDEQVRELAAYFTTLSGHESPTPVGLDVEWRPTSTKIASHIGGSATTAIASILQIATATKVFLLDLLTLHVRGSMFNGVTRAIT
jgi:hypothetical protein